MSYLHAVKNGWSMAPRHRIVTPSKFGYTVKVFLACDDGQRICSECCGECDGALDKYGPVTKFGTCYNCGLKVERY